VSKATFNRQNKAHPIPRKALVKVTEMNHIVELVYTHNVSNTLEKYVKLDKNSYAVIERETGEVLEVKDYEIKENRAQNIAGLKRSMKKIRDLINNNFTGGLNELFITLTYALVDGKPMTDTKKASRDFQTFIKRFKRKFHDAVWLAVLEPQASGAWHWHLLVKFTDWKSPAQIRIDNNEVIFPLWGHGWTKTKSLNRVDNIGAYLGGYLSSVEISEENREEIFDTVYKSGRDLSIEEKEVTGANGKKISKKFVKGGRLHLYPSGTNIYRCSREIKPPKTQNITYGEAKELVGNRPPDYAQTVIVESGERDEHHNSRQFNKIVYENYNLKRNSTTPAK